MAFTVEDFDDLIRLLEENREWLQRLRQLLLGEEVMVLPAQVQALQAVIGTVLAEVARHQQEQTRVLSSMLAVLQTITSSIQALTNVQERQVEALIRFRLEVDQRFADLAANQARLEEAVAKLAEAQRQAEERLARLEEAQIRTEERLARLEEAVAKLAEAQRQAEERLAKLEEAQIRAEERLARLEEAQIRTEERLARLGETQIRIQEEIRDLTAQIRRLVLAQQAMGDQLNRFGSVVGIVAEERMAVYMERWLESRGYQLQMPISSLPLDSETEIDGVTQVRDAEGNVEWLLISVRVRARPRDFEDFAGILSRERIRRLLRERGIQGRIRPFIFGMTMQLGAVQAAHQHRIGLILSERGEMAPAGLWEL